MELASFLATLACRVHPPEESLIKPQVQSVPVDPWHAGRDPWSQPSAKGKGSGNLQGKGIFVPPPLVQTVEKIVEVPVLKYVDVPQVQMVEKIVEVEVEKIVYKHVEARVGVDVACEAKENTIRAECLLSAPVAAHRAEFESKIAEHKTRYPGGMLPSELYNFEDYMGRIRHRLDVAEQEKMTCLRCGHFPCT